MAREAGDRHHVAASAIAHRRDDGLDGIESPEHVDPELGLQRLRVRSQRLGAESDARVGDQEVDRTEPLAERRDGGVRLVAPGGIGWRTRRPDAGGAHFDRQPLEPVRPPGGEPQVVALARQLQCERPADSARCAGDDRDPGHAQPVQNEQSSRVAR